MKKLLVLTCCMCLMFGFLVGNVFSLDITASPKTLVLSSQGHCVTIHTDIDGDLVLDAAVAVDGTEIAASFFEDDCGNLVARSSRDDVKQIIGLSATQAVFTLTVDTELGTFSASDTVRVKK